VFVRLQRINHSAVSNSLIDLPTLRLTQKIRITDNLSPITGSNDSDDGGVVAFLCHLVFCWEPRMDTNQHE
jgi:hypothetical protein